MKNDKCHILFSPRGGCEPTDATGCSRDAAHYGPHRFRDTAGRTWEWEQDMDCRCEDCMSDEFTDACIVYHEVTPRRKPTAKRVLSNKVDNRTPPKE